MCDFKWLPKQQQQKGRKRTITFTYQTIQSPRTPPGFNSLYKRGWVIIFMLPPTTQTVFLRERLEETGIANL